MTDTQTLHETGRDLEPIKARLREIFVEALRLDIPPASVGEEHIAEQLGIDSVKALEVLVWVEDEFHMQFHDEDLNPKLLDSMNTLAAYIASHTSA